MQADRGQKAAEFEIHAEVFTGQPAESAVAYGFLEIVLAFGQQETAFTGGENLDVVRAETGDIPILGEMPAFEKRSVGVGQIQYERNFPLARKLLQLPQRRRVPPHRDFDNRLRLRPDLT